MKTLTNLGQGWPFAYRYYCDAATLERLDLATYPGDVSITALIINAFTWIIGSSIVCLAAFRFWIALGTNRTISLLLLFSAWSWYNYLKFTGSQNWAELGTHTLPVNLAAGAALLVAIVVSILKLRSRKTDITPAMPEGAEP